MPETHTQSWPARIDELHGQRPQGGEAPDAPFKKTEEWVGLAFRRALQDAAERGMDRVAWVSGEQAADLYDLRKQVSRIEWHEESGGLQAFGLEGEHVLSERNVSADKLADFIGKGPAQRLIDATPERPRDGGPSMPAWRFIEGDDLAVGGAGMEQFYNRIVPNVVKKEAKRLGVQIEPVRIAERRMDMNDELFPERVPTDPTNLSIRLTPLARDRILNEGQRIGGTPAVGARSLAGGALGAAGGAAVAPEGSEIEGALAGAAIGGGIPLLLTKLGKRGAGTSRIEADQIRRAEAEAADPLRISGPIEDIDPDHVRIAKFALDPDGERALAESVRRVVANEGALTPRGSVSSTPLADKPVESFETMRQVAESLGLTPGEVANAKNLSRHEMIAVRDLVNRNIRFSSEIDKKLARGEYITAEEQNRALHLMSAAATQTDALLTRFIRQRTEDGRNLAAHRILANDNLDPFTWYTRAKTQLGGVTVPADIRAKIDELISTEDRDALAELVSGLRHDPIANQLTALWKAGLLSAPTTHIVNVVSTAGNLAFEGVKDIPAAMADRVFTGVLRMTASAGAISRGHLKPEIGAHEIGR